MAGFDINGFTAEIANRGVLRNNKFLVTLPVPSGLKDNQVSGLGEFNSIQRTLSLWCEAANMPGAGLLTSDVRRYGYGVAEKKPYSVAFTDVNLRFRCDAKGLVHAYLHNWMRIAVCYQNGPGALTQKQVGPINGQLLWEVGYKEEYQVQADITAYDDTGKESLKITLRDAFPVFVGDIALDWGMRGQYATVAASLTFFDWYTQGLAAVGQNNQTE